MLLDESDSPETAANSQAAANNDVQLIPVDAQQNASTAKPANDTDKKSDADSDKSKIVKGHGFQLGLTFVHVPDILIDRWFKKHGSMWDGAPNMGFSLDYILRFERPCEMRFSLSWISAKTGDAYWLHQDHKDQPQLADYVIQDYSIVAIEIAAYHVVPIVKNAGGLTEFDFFYGGGIWGGIILGDADRYSIRASCARDNDDFTSCPHEPGKSPFLELPWGIGFANATLGFKFTFVDIMTMRLEGGFKGYIYAQLGLGVEF